MPFLILMLISKGAQTPSLYPTQRMSLLARKSFTHRLNFWARGKIFQRQPIHDTSTSCSFRVTACKRRGKGVRGNFLILETPIHPLCYRDRETEANIPGKPRFLCLHSQCASSADSNDRPRFRS